MSGWSEIIHTNGLAFIAWKHCNIKNSTATWIIEVIMLLLFKFIYPRHDQNCSAGHRLAVGEVEQTIPEMGLSLLQ